MTAVPSAATPVAPVGTPSQQPVPDWGNQVGLVQPRQAAFWLWLVCVVIGSYLLLNDQVQYLNYSPLAFVIAFVLLAIFAIPVFLIIVLLDLFEREPVSLMIGAFVWGAVVVLPFALPINNSWVEIIFKVFGVDTSLPWVLAVIPPIVEEALKFAGVVVIYLIARNEFDDVLDGFIYGALVGLGFQISEDMFYLFTRFIGPAGGVNELGALLEGYWIRIISGGLYSHPLYTGISGMGLAYWATRLDQPKAKRQQVLVGALLLAVLMHAFWNAPFLQDVFLGDNPGPLNFLLFATVKGLPLLIFVLIVIRLATQREQHHFQLVMAAQGTDAATPEELRDLSDQRRRFVARRRVKAEKGPAAAKMLSRLQHEQIRYAMIITQERPDREAALAQQLALIRALRGQLAAMPDLPKVAPVVVPVQAAGVTAATQSATPTGAAAATTGATAATAAAPPVPAPGAPTWAPSHRVPPTGQQSWDQPDPARPVTMLAPGLDLQVVQQVGDWARVVAINGWSGWVDARLLIPIAR